VGGSVGGLSLCVFLNEVCSTDDLRGDVTNAHGSFITPADHCSRGHLVGCWRTVPVCSAFSWSWRLRAGCCR
jgi:hypothetical protein